MLYAWRTTDERTGLPNQTICEQQTANEVLPMPINFDDVISVPDHVLVRQMDDELVILDLNTEAYFGLNDVGTAMWTSLQETSSIDDAYGRLLDIYDVAPETLRHDIETLLQQLVDQQLIEIHARES